MSGAESNPGSLQNLHDIVAPTAVEWYPPAPGGYLLMALAAAGVAFLAYRQVRHWQRNRYRRTALRQLKRLRAGGQARQAATEIAILLKQTALAAWPRAEVASLSGATWAGFLVRTGASEQAANRLSQLGYDQRALQTDSLHQICDDAAAWVRRHRREPR